MKTIYIYSKELASPGIKVIVNNLTNKLLEKGQECVCTSNMENRTKSDIIIPYGPKESFELITFGYPLHLSLLVDYYSLGCRNKIKFYLKKGKFFYKDFLYSIYAYLKYHSKEIKIANTYNALAMVSKNDIQQLATETDIKKCFYIRNGVNLNRNIQHKNKDLDKLVLGVISNWQFVSIDETKWFVEDVMPTIGKHYPNVLLRIAGRGDYESAQRVFARYPNVEFIGPVDSLDDFFNNLDIYVATVPKGCGILNKVLDAFSYKVFTIGVAESFSGIDGLENGYIACRTNEDFIEAINVYITQKDKVNEMIENAYSHIVKYHNFGNNYDEIVDYIVSIAK